MLLEFTYRFEAAHRFLKSSSVPCMTPHGHTWYATVGFRYIGKALDNSQMTVEFTKAKQSFRELIQSNFDHSYLHNWQDPIVEVLRATTADVRLIPFPGDPTTELIALLIFHKTKVMLLADSTTPLEVNFIRIQETPTNQITCDKEFYLSQIQGFHSPQSWWSSLDPLDRSFTQPNLS